MYTACVVTSDPKSFVTRIIISEPYFLKSRTKQEPLPPSLLEEKLIHETLKQCIFKRNVLQVKFYNTISFICLSVSYSDTF